MATVSDHKTLDCPMCFKKFTTPRVLPCSHSFCEECLGEHIKTHAQHGSSFMCPLCATPTVLSDSNLALEKWASAFPLNTLINSVLESTENLDISDRSCEPCKIDGETSTAEYWCVDCSGKLCNSCYKSHKRMKQLKHHEIIDIDDMKEGLHSNFDFNQVCGRHRGKIKELFCIDHKELCCAVCVATDHRQCNDVRSIDDITRDQSQRSDYSSIIQDFRKLKTEMEKIMTQKKTNTKQVLQEKDQILHDMDNRIDTIIRHLNKLKNDFRNETEQMYKETESSMVENQKNVQSFMTNIDSSSEILEVVEKNGTSQQKFTTFEHLRSQIMSHYNQLNLHLKDDVDVHFTWKGSKLLHDLQETLNSVGSVEVLKKSSTMSRDVLHGTDKFIKNLNFRTKIGTEMCAAQVEKFEDLMTSPVTFVKSVTRDKLGNKTDFAGGTFLGNRRLLMCDYDNNRLVELDDEYNLVKEYKLDGKPTDVAAGNKDDELYVAVRAPSERYIYKCTLHTNLTIVIKIKAPSGTCGIAVSGDNIIVGTRDAVVILAQDGSTVRSFYMTGHNVKLSKMEQFLMRINSYEYVAVSQSTIYHGDNYDVVCRTWEGQEVFRYQHQQLKGPHGMYVDRHGCLYICGTDSHNVHQVSSDGQTSRIIQLHNISRPWSVTLHPQKNQLIVTSNNENTVCEIYKLA